MGTKWLMVIVATVVMALTMVTNAVAGEVIHIIVYDVMKQQIISVTDKNGSVVDKPSKDINGIPKPLYGKIIRRADSIQILSDIASPHCTCYGNWCIGPNCW